jgi:hypothetical protein
MNNHTFDWKKEAWDCAREYLEDNKCSKEEVREWLEYKQFTIDEIQYAMSKIQ